MQSLPDDFDTDELAAALTREWGVAVAELVHAPVGFGSHHWTAIDPSGGRWFVTVDDLEIARVAVSETYDDAYARLARALTTARALRDSGAGFVVAPVPTAGGEAVVRLGPRWAGAVYPHVDGTSYAWEQWTGDDHRRGVLDMVLGVHAAPPAVREKAGVDDLSVPRRDAVEAALAGRPAGENPDAARPTGEGSNAAGNEPNTGRPTGDGSSTGRTAGNEPNTGRATGDGPHMGRTASNERPAGHGTNAGRPADEEPNADHAGGGEPSAGRPAGGEGPNSGRPTAEGPNAARTAGDEPSAGRAAGDEPSADRPGGEEPATARAAGGGPYTDRTAALLAEHADQVAARFARYDRMIAGVDRSRDVLTHGEPHPANSMRTDGGWRLIDWDTALVAPPERDLWLLGAAMEEPYARATGTPLRPEVLALYREWWELADLAIGVARFRGVHHGGQDDDDTWAIIERVVRAS